jgi:hypothetical protein
LAFGDNLDVLEKSLLTMPGVKPWGHPAHSLATIVTTLSRILLTCMAEMGNTQKVVTVNSKEA